MSDFNAENQAYKAAHEHLSQAVEYFASKLNPAETAIAIYEITMFLIRKNEGKDVRLLTQAEGAD